MSMKHLLSFLISLVFVAAASANSVVHWQGDYVGSNDRALNLPSATDNGGVRTYEFSAANSLVPTTGYTAPSARSSTFYGAMQNSQASGTPGNFGAIAIAKQVVDEGSNFRVQGGTGDSTISGLIMFKKEDFLNGYDTGTLALGGLGGNMDIYDVTATSAVFRYAVLNGTQWYLSQAVATGNTLFSVADLASGNWGAWDPTGAPLDAAPGSFATSGSTLNNVQAVGFYFHLERDDSTPRFRVNEFQVIPEPTTMGLMSILVLACLPRRPAKVH